MINIKIFKDGNMWCAMIGDNLESGIGGFGINQLDSIKDLYKNIDQLNIRLKNEWERINMCTKNRKFLGEKCSTHIGLIENCDDCPYQT